MLHSLLNLMVLKPKYSRRTRSIMVSDALALYVTRPSVAMVWLEKRVLYFHNGGFQLLIIPISCPHWEMIKNTSMMSCFLKNFSMTRINKRGPGRYNSLLVLELRKLPLYCSNYHYQYQMPAMRTNVLAGLVTSWQLARLDGLTGIWCHW